ncbi:MAG: heme A synthase [Chloroflexi bacterium]|nr:heme A synthase [Chloroflexota bacterium]
MAVSTAFVSNTESLAAARRDTWYANLSLSAFLSALVLILVGSIVRVTGNGLGCPDWPLCYGQVIPPLQIAPWVEFSHRLVGAFTSIQIVAMAVLAWRWHRRNGWMVQPTLLGVGFLAAQVALGGIHVIFELPPASGWMHTGMAMAVTACVASQVAATHPAAQRLSARMKNVIARDRGLPVALATSAAMSYLLILTGSYVTRTGASLACPTFPHCGADTYEFAFPALINIQMFHRFAAFGVALTVGLVLLRLVRAGRAERGLQIVSAILAALIVIQFGLGVSNVIMRLPMWSRSLHLLVAAMLWTGLLMLWVVAQRGKAGAQSI